MAKIVTLKNSNDEEVYPVTTAEAVNGGLYADSEGTPSTVTADITSARIADRAVTADKIDFTTLAPYWKVVSTVSTNAWTIPAGYRFYRLVMRCVTTAPSVNSRPAIAASSKSGKAWSAWVSNDIGTTTAGTSNWDTSSQTITVVAPNMNTAACAPIVKMDLTRLASGGTGFTGTWTCSGSGFDWVSVGKVEFSVASGSSDFYLYFTRNDSTLSDFTGYVEAMVES